MGWGKAGRRAPHRQNYVRARYRTSDNRPLDSPTGEHLPRVRSSSLNYCYGRFEVFGTERAHWEGGGGD